MEELVVDLHVLVVDGPVEGDGDHHRQLAQLQLAALHTWGGDGIEASLTSDTKTTIFARAQSRVETHV